MTGVLYDPRRTYGAHQPIGGGVQSDELWSTPLVQSLTELRRQGVPREEVDKVVLELMFGLGAGFRMPDLATKTVTAAKALFPSGPHAGVFESSFRKLGILPDGQPSAAVGAATDDAQVSKK